MSESLSQRVAALEAERDAAIKRADYLLDENKAWREKGMSELKLRLEVERARATAQVEGAREALTRLAERIKNGCRDYQFAHPNEEWKPAAIKMFRDREYPSAPRASEGERCGVCGYFGGEHADYCEPRPTPQAAPEPFIVLPAAQSWTDDGQPRGGVTHHVHITPADARRIVQMGGGT